MLFKKGRKLIDFPIFGLVMGTGAWGTGHLP